MIRRWSAISGALLLLLFLLAVYVEVDPDWKSYQRRFNRMEQEKLREDFRRAAQRLEQQEVREKRRVLEAEHQRLRAEFDKPETQRHYHEALGMLRTLEERLERAQSNLQKIRADYQSLERGFILASEERQMAQLKRKLEAAKVVDRKSTRLNSSHIQKSRMPSSA